MPTGFGRFILLAALLVLVACAAAVQGLYRTVASTSMYPTLEKGDRIIFEPFRSGDRIARGDIILYRAIARYEDGTPIEEMVFLSRVIGLPGDDVEVNQSGQPTVNGNIFERERVRRETLLGQHGALPISIFLECASKNKCYKVGDLVEYSGKSLAQTRVPDGHVFVMGDNRDNSLDSRFPERGPIPIEGIFGIGPSYGLGSGENPIDPVPTTPED